MTEPPAGRSRRKLLLDWKVWVGIALPVAALLYTVHDIRFADVAADIAGARLLPIALIIPVNLFALWLRSARWMLFTASLSNPPAPFTPHLQATAVGAFAINVLPFRIGELARPWALAKQTQLTGSAALGTVVLERVIDLTTLSLVGGGLLYFQAKTLPAWVQTGGLLAATFSALPVAFLVLLRLRRDWVLGWIERPLGYAPASLQNSAMELVREVCLGLESLRGRRTVTLVALLSLVLWVLVIPLPFALGLFAFGVEMPPAQFFMSVMTAHVFTALAVAAPSAPGFIGVYHFACREALALFGVSSTVAVGFGTVVHMSYWLPITLVGAFAAMQVGARMSDITEPSLGKAASEPHR